MQRWLTAALDLVYPRACAACGAALDSRHDGHVCWDCLGELQVVAAPLCRWCGDPAAGEVGVEYTCSWCVRTEPAFDRARSAVRFRAGVRPVIHALKYGQAAGLAADLMPLLEACVRTHYARVEFDGVAAVPLHHRRERERSYNQSALLARRMARRLRVPCFDACVRRVRATPSQTNLNAQERKANVRDAFAVAHPEWLEGRTLLLVDDVMTTGATVHECARTLKGAGAAAVYVATVARG